MQLIREHGLPLSDLAATPKVVGIHFKTNSWNHQPHKLLVSAECWVVI